MIDRNGGYAIVDLKGKTLSGTPTTILGTHSAIKKAIAGSKPILLTGLTTGGPCFVQISVSGTSYVISGVYGNDITVTSADAVTSAESGGGGGLLTWSVLDYNAYVIYTFAYEPGMTFGDFINSDYNVNNIVSVDLDVPTAVVVDGHPIWDPSFNSYTTSDDIYGACVKGISTYT